jgi:hypothetical protein
MVEVLKREQWLSVSGATDVPRSWHSLDGVTFRGLDEIARRKRVVVVGKPFIHSRRDFLCEVPTLRHGA